MTAEDPRELLAQEMLKARRLMRERAESQTRAALLRQIRIANGFDRLIAELLGGAR